jgi:truncated hemoglobin YjbI/ankyrin repeat protein
LVDALYDRFEEDQVLRPLFVRDLTHERANQKYFFAEWLGGPKGYSAFAHAGLKHRHDRLQISRDLAGRWLGHFRRALAASVVSEGDRAMIQEQAQAVAFALVNDDTVQGKRAAQPPGTGHHPTTPAPPRVSAVQLAHKGDAAGIRALVKERPETFRNVTWAALVMQAAALAGKSEVVSLLLDLGVDIDKPFFLPVGVVGQSFERIIFVTPLCAGRMKRRTAVTALLERQGAKEDRFTAAFLGDLPRLERQLAADVELAQTPDPATDVVEITPVHHAVAGDRPAALRALLEGTRAPLVGGDRALRGAAEKNSVEMVELLVARGARATSIGSGRWVLHPKLAPMLARAGASCAYPEGRWIHGSCTGNQGRKDDPDYVRALIRHGARLDDLYNGATALHYAAKAGFLGILGVLLEHGADRDARDFKGRTPLDWVEQAAKTVPREPVRRLLKAKPSKHR